jgi:hypothetical protein
MTSRSASGGSGGLLKEFRTVSRICLIAVTSWALVLSVGGCGREPQIGESKEVFKVVDALYTAVGVKDAKLVDQCAATLKTLLASGSLPPAASKSLDAVIAETKVGKWEAAQERLRRFMEGQRG